MFDKVVHKAFGLTIHCHCVFICCLEGLVFPCNVLRQLVRTKSTNYENVYNVSLTKWRAHVSSFKYLSGESLK